MRIEAKRSVSRAAMLVEASVEQTIEISSVIMYNKCGCINDSQQVLKSMHACDTVSWNTTIADLVQSGYGFQALQLLHEMEDLGASMDYVTLVELLYACSHAGILDVESFFWSCLRMSMVCELV
ncbi:hypothetical protein KP509_18G031300 [Ceratopteris richardii]|uniref:Pentatricopeptide repeat-containing protein n=2 Tax=Ceratopteris richardii TaxID=49495 RepID=A0A8T2SS67_CERRI|nr:hypothetical protein KP509_18G031300 [Ceratopteris richardii]